MIERLRHARTAARGDDGFSLPEMLVTLIIFSMIVLAVTTLAIGFAKTNGQNISRQDQIEGGRLSVETITKYLRTAVMPSQLTCTTCTADAFVNGQDFSMQFYANIGNPGNSVGPSRITYQVVTTGATAGDLVEKIQTPDSPVPGATGYAYCDAEAAAASVGCKSHLQTRTVVHGVQTGMGPVFKYFKSDQTQLLPAGGGALTADDLSDILAVELSVSVKATKGISVDPTTYVGRVTLPNAQSALRIQEDS